MYAADEYAHVVYRVDLATATIGIYAGNGAATNLDGTGDGGPATAAEVPYPQGLTVDDADNLYILQIENQVRRVDQAGVITTVSAGPYVSDDVGIEYHPASRVLYPIGNDYPRTNTLYLVG